MNTLINYRHYRSLQLRNAHILAGIDKVVLPALRGAALAAILLLAYGVVSRTVEAGQVSADNRATAKVAGQAAYIKNLETTLARCLSGGDNAIKIGDEVWFCGATNSGIKAK